MICLNCLYYFLFMHLICPLFHHHWISPVFFFIYIFRGERDWLCIAPMQINDRDYSISVKSLDDDIENV